LVKDRIRPGGSAKLPPADFRSDDLVGHAEDILAELAGDGEVRQDPGGEADPRVTELR
jgi:hypothetical protein